MWNIGIGTKPDGMVVEKKLMQYLKPKVLKVFFVFRLLCLQMYCILSPFDNRPVFVPHGFPNSCDLIIAHDFSQHFAIEQSKHVKYVKLAVKMYFSL